MSAIHILDSLVIDRIAAGEVVERPASVIKELIENSLDAGAQRISVQLEDAGTGLIEVVDDGHGIDPVEVELAFAQHATSKVATLNDLDAITTLGFRGEALASIASVSCIELTTGTGDGPGVRIKVEGGQILHVERVAWPHGTTVRVADLFFNTPARRKNLKKPATELRHASQVVTDYALCRPDIYVSLAHGKRSLIAVPPAATLADRINDILGDQVASNWLSVERKSGPLSIRGGITNPDHQRPNRNEIRWVVNGRPVSDYRLVHALVSAYESLLDHKRFPVSVIFLELPVGDVDVNVHPRKAEVRFANPRAVYQAVRNSVRESLARQLPPVNILGGDDRYPGGNAEYVVESESAAASFGGSQYRSVAETGSQSLPVNDWIVSEGTPTTIRNQSTLPPGKEISGTAGSIRPLAQYDNTYIVAADRKGILVIDQHVAHERVLYEQVLTQVEARKVEAQHLLVPETIELTAGEAAIIEEHSDLLESLGFVIEPFGGKTWALRTVPAILGSRDLGETMRSLITSLEQGAGPEALKDARQDMAASIACHAAVRANHPLTREEMVHLIADLERCESPTRCPHGRPILVRVDHDELERRLKRH
jgi:DNA mismatch repair protein MutL